jgi:hypothetical protein
MAALLTFMVHRMQDDTRWGLLTVDGETYTAQPDEGLRFTLSEQLPVSEGGEAPDGSIFYAITYVGPDDPRYLSAVISQLERNNFYAISTPPAEEQIKVQSVERDLAISIWRADGTVTFPEDAPYAAAFRRIVEQRFNKAQKQIKKEVIEELVQYVLLELEDRYVQRTLLDFVIKQAILSFFLTYNYGDTPIDDIATLNTFIEALTGGIASGAIDVNKVLYAMGKAPTLELGIAFNIENKAAIKALKDRLTFLDKTIPDSTRLKMVDSFASAFSELGPGDAKALTDLIYSKLTSKEHGAFSQERIASIVRTEMNALHSAGRLDQFRAIGLKKKRWIAVPAIACPICLRNQALGPVPIDFNLYGSAGFGAISHPPGHPNVCHCSIDIDLDELVAIAEEPLDFWDGGEELTERHVRHDLVILEDEVLEERHGNHHQKTHGNRGPGAAGGADDFKTFSSDDGYAWHDQHNGWAGSLSADDVDVLTSYASFSYSDINAVARGDTSNLIKKEVRPATDAERKGFTEAITKGDKPPALGLGESYLVSGFGVEIEKQVPDTERIARATTKADRLQEVITKRGLQTTEPMEVLRAAYVPGMADQDVQALAGKTFTDKGFMSTMVGSAGGRVDTYVAHGKAESLYKRHGGKIDVEETGAALSMRVQLPKGTPYASVEAVRRLGDPTRRSESELLLKSGSRFRVKSVKVNAGTATLADFSTPYHEVTLEYIG